MRHRLKGRKLGRTTSHRQAMARNLVTSLFVYGRVITTVTRAKEFRGLAERMITLAKNASGKDAPTRLAHLRRILRTVQDRKVARKILDDVAKRFTDRAGGYTRISSSAVPAGTGTGATVRVQPAGRQRPKAIWELVVRKDREEEMKLAGRGRAAHEAEEAKRAEKKSKKAPAATS